VHIEAVLELANIIQPHTIPMYLITRSADMIVNIILNKKEENSKFMTLIVTQAYILLVAAMAHKSLKGKENKKRTYNNNYSDKARRVSRKCILN